MTRVPYVTLNDGIEMPMLGLGVYMAEADQTADVVAHALSAGYRLIDTAAFYGNERGVGDGIRQSGLVRSEVFVTTKLWISDYGFDPSLRAVDASLRELGLDYVDLYLLHWPTPSVFDATIACWRAAERIRSEGRARAIGVSNFNPGHLDRLIAATGTVPAVNQIELHPLFSQPRLREENARRGIVTQAWSPIGGIHINHPDDRARITRVLDHPVLVDLAKRHGRTPAQITLRWHIQHGVAVIPKSANPDRIRQNIAVFDFALGPDEMDAIDALDSGIRGGRDPEVFDMDFVRARAAAAGPGQKVSAAGRPLP
jgi:diketogulonate reductase-like aldo/keto reductase